MKFVKKGITIFAILILMLTFSVTTYAKNTTFTVDGIQFMSYLDFNFLYCDLRFAVQEDAPGWPDLDKSELAIRVYYRDRNGNTYSTNYGMQTCENAQGHAYDVPSSIFQTDDYIYQVKGWYRVTRNGQSKSGELYCYN